MTLGPRSSSSPARPVANSFPSPSTIFASMHGTTGPTEAGFAT